LSQELKVLKCRNCQLKKINPQMYNLLPLLSELDLGRNEVCFFLSLKKEFFQLFFPFFQFKFLDRDEFRDVKRLTKVLLDGNQLSVVVDQLFRMQKSLNHLGAPLKLYPILHSLLKTLNCFPFASFFFGFFVLLKHLRFIVQSVGQSAQ